MNQHTHGGAIYQAMSKLNKSYDQIIDFSANINPLGIPQKVLQALEQGLPLCVHYPDPFCTELTEKLASKHQVDADYVLCGNGAADLIYKLVQSQKPKRALLCAPTFSEYEAALQTVDAKIEYYKLKEENDFKLDEDYLKALHEELDIIFICNPNNPTGQILQGNLLEKVLKQCKMLDILCVIDECFLDFVEYGAYYTAENYLKNYKNIIILKAFTKSYAIPGLRLGYTLTAHTLLHEQMKRSHQYWSVSTLAQIAGIAALDATQYIEESRAFINTQRTFLEEGLNALGFKVYDTYANYIFFKNHTPCLIHEALFKEGILIRNCDNYKGLEPGYYRIAIKTAKENQKLLESLERVLKTWQNH